MSTAEREAIATEHEEEWYEQPERGTILGLRLLLGVYRLIGERGMRVALLPVALYFTATSRTARLASADYLTRLRRANPDRHDIPAPGIISAFRHLYAFSRSILDSIRVWRGEVRDSDIRLFGIEALRSLQRSGKGAIILGAHVGNMEVMRSLSSVVGRPQVTVLMYLRNALKFRTVIHALHERAALNIQPVESLTPAVILDLQGRLRRGEFVAVTGDRTSPSAPGRTIRARFLGDDAIFPHGVFRLSSLLGAPVVSLFCVRVGDGFELHCKHHDPGELPGSYVRELERICERAPLQWFNFFPFWGESRSV